MQWKPNVTVAAIAEQDGRYLLVEEIADGHTVFNQPAGHLEENETLLDAIKREVLEETAWTFHPQFLIGVYLYPSKFTDTTYLRFCFSGHCSEQDTSRKLDTDIIRTVWLTKEEIESGQEKLRSPLVLRCLNDYLTGEKYPLNLLNDCLTTDHN